MPATTSFQVILEPDEEEGGYTVYCPALPGCISEGDTYDAALANITEAIRLYLRAIAREAESLRQSSARPVMLAEVAV